MKRFWSAAAPVEAADGWEIALDGKPVRTPMRTQLAVPTKELAQAIAE